MITYDPFNKPAITYRTTSEAFKDADYARCIEYGYRNPWSVTPHFVAALTALSLCATIVAYFYFS